MQQLLQIDLEPWEVIAIIDMDAALRQAAAQASQRGPSLTMDVLDTLILRDN